MAVVLLACAALLGAHIAGAGPQPATARGQGASDVANTLPDALTDSAITGLRLTLTPTSLTNRTVSSADADEVGRDAVLGGETQESPTFELASALVMATLDGRPACTCWAVRVVVIRLPLCPYSYVKEDLLYLVDTQRPAIDYQATIRSAGSTPFGACSPV